MFAEPGWSSYGQKKRPRLEADRSLGDERLVSHFDWKFTPLGFYRAIFCHKNPEAATTLEKFCFWTLRGRRQDNEVGRQRSQGCTACTDWVILWWCTFCPSAFRLVNFMRNFFVVAWPYQIKRKCLSSFWKKKLVWFFEWAIIFMSGCSWNFFSELFCEMHSVVTVKTVINFNDANICCTTRSKIRCRQFVMWSRTIFQKTEGVAETKSER